MTRFFNDIISRLKSRFLYWHWFRFKIWRHNLRVRLGRWYLRLWYWLWDRFY
jgi:hypothetical protein